MKTILVPTILAATFVAARALAGDVAYQLETKPLRSIEQPTLAQPLTVAFEERIWALPGLEDAAGGDYRNWSTGIDRVRNCPESFALFFRRLLPLLRCTDSDFSSVSALPSHVLAT